MKLYGILAITLSGIFAIAAEPSDQQLKNLRHIRGIAYEKIGRQCLDTLKELSTLKIDQKTSKEFVSNMAQREKSLRQTFDYEPLPYFSVGQRLSLEQSYDQFPKFISQAKLDAPAWEAKLASLKNELRLLDLVKKQRCDGEAVVSDYCLKLPSRIASSNRRLYEFEAENQSIAYLEQFEKDVKEWERNFVKKEGNAIRVPIFEKGYPRMQWLVDVDESYLQRGANFVVVCQRKLFAVLQEKAKSYNAFNPGNKISFELGKDYQIHMKQEVAQNAPAPGKVIKTGTSGK